MALMLQKLRIKVDWVRECMAEFLGTFVLIVIGDASVAQSVLSGSTSGTMLSINLSWGLAVMIGVFVSGGVSGGHLNPAVTLAMAICGKLPWKKVPHYMGAQFLGAFVGAACVYWTYYDAIQVQGFQYTITTAGIFSTYPQPYLSHLNAVVDQIVGTGILLLGIMAITDNKNMNAEQGMVPLFVGLVVAAIGMTLGHNCGYAINPARDLSPRFFCFIAGWGSEVFTFANHYWWIPTFVPFIGAILGALTYILFVGIHIPEYEEGRNTAPSICETWKPKLMD